MLDQADPTDAELEKSIYTGVDCCRDAIYKYKTIRIIPETAVIKPGDSIYLQGATITYACDPACFHWRIIRGGGRLTDDYGYATQFYAPDTVEACEGSAEIALFCSGWIVDTCRIGVNEYTEDDIAYWKVEDWKDGYLYDHTAKKATKTIPSDRYPGLDPKRSMIRISARRCDGSLTKTYYPGLIQGSEATAIGYKLQKRWFGVTIREGQLSMDFGELGNTFEDAKTRLLRNALFRWVRALVPTQRPWSDAWQAFYDSYRTWTFSPGTVLDVRTPPMREAKCCPPELI